MASLRTALLPKDVVVCLSPEPTEEELELLRRVIKAMKGFGRVSPDDPMVTTARGRAELVEGDPKASWPEVARGA